MVFRILSFALIFACAGASFAAAKSAQEKELKEKIKKYCGDHRKYVQKGGSKSECGDRDNARLARKLDALAKEADKECVKTVKFFLETKVDFERIVRDGTRNAENLRAKVDASESLSINELHTIQEANVKSLYTSAQQTNASIRASYESHHKRHNVISAFEKTYEKLKDEIGYHHDEQICQGRERNWYGVEAYNLEEEMETLRESIAKNMQTLTKLYQQNLVALGASKSQALTLARDLVNFESMEELPKPEGVALEVPNQVKVRNDGLLEGAERGTIADKLDRTFGRNRPYEKEWQEVKCPEGVNSPSCWERGYKAKESRIDDATLAAFSGKLSGAQSATNDHPTYSGSNGAVLGALQTHEEATRMNNGNGLLDLSAYNKLSAGEFEALRAYLDNVENAEYRAPVEINGQRFEDIKVRRTEGAYLSPAETYAYIPEGDGYRAVPVDGDKVKVLGFSIETPTIDPEANHADIMEQLGATVTEPEPERAPASSKPALNLAKPSVLPGHGANEVSQDGVSQFYTQAGGARFTEQDGEKVDDGFSDLYLAGRNATYMETTDDVYYTGKPAKSDEVRTLQGNINYVLKEGGYSQRITADGIYGAQTQSALDFIGKNPDLRKKLLQKQGRTPAGR